MAKADHRPVDVTLITFDLERGRLCEGWGWGSE
jgi:hypothetical protein